METTQDKQYLSNKILYIFPCKLQFQIVIEHVQHCDCSVFKKKKKKLDEKKLDECVRVIVHGSCWSAAMHMRRLHGRHMLPRFSVED